MKNTSLNGAELAILNSRMEGIVRKMANTLARTGRSGVLNRAKDFSCCIVTADCELLAAAESLPIHVLSGPDMMAKSMIEFHPDLKRGDAFFHNSPYHGCSHPADLTILVPVIDDEGIHRFTVIAKAHQADIGNSEPTTYMATAKDVYNEGALIFASTQVQRGYKDIEDIIRICEMRIRVPKQWHGDYLATVGSVRIGERELLAMGEDVGWDTLEAFQNQWFDYSESLMVETIKNMASATAIGESTHDPFPGLPEEGVKIKADVRVDAEGAMIHVDLRDNPDCLPSGLNLSEACSRTAAMMGIFNSINHKGPKNAGAFRRINVELRRGCIAGITEHPYSCSAATTNISDRVANCVQRAFSEMSDEVGMGEIGAVMSPSCGVVSGVDERNGKNFVNQVFIAYSAGAATAAADAWWTIAHVGNGGMCCLDGIELDELYQPLLIKSRSFMPDTEGAGRFTGAPSTFVEYGPIIGKMEIAYGADGNLNVPRGVRGGGSGGGSDQHIRRADGTVERLPNCEQITLSVGETILCKSTGGGGYGNPSARTLDKISHDVSEGWLTPERARNIYLAAVDDRGMVDEAATADLRRIA